MNEYDELFKNFSKLGVNDKRNVLNEEIMKISYIITQYLGKYNQQSALQPYNYNKKIDQNLTEAQMLDICFKDIYYIKSNLLLLMGLIEKV